ncbi:MAG: hypothetical protein ABIP42_04090 [Planctomycetota bacterium]
MIATARWFPHVNGRDDERRCCLRHATRAQDVVAMVGECAIGDVDGFVAALRNVIRRELVEQARRSLLER